MMQGADVTDTSDARQILERISAVAAQRRREAQPALDRPLAEWILEVIQSEVVYTLNPRMLPIRLVSFTSLRELLYERFAVRFVRPDLGPLPTDPQLSDDQLGSALLPSGRTVRFENGRFRRTADDFDAIRSINIDDESIHVAVQGVSSVAELIVADVAEIIWAAAGALRRWDEIKAAASLVGYATDTEIDLGMPLEKLLSVEFRDFMASDVLDGKCFAYETARRSARHKFNVSPDLTATWGLDRISLQFYLFDGKTGRSDITKMYFRVPTRDLVGTGRIVVYSELPFNKHIECLGALRSRASTSTPRTLASAGHEG
jgi:hypothetical protein